MLVAYFGIEVSLWNYFLLRSGIPAASRAEA